MTAPDDGSATAVEPGPPGRARAWAPRAVTLGDQVLSSVSNLLAVVLVARAVSAEAFGTFALGYSVMTVVLSLTRAYFGTRVSLSADPLVAREHARALVGAVALLAVPVALGVYLVSRLMVGGGDPATGVLVVVAIATPIVCMQDVLRFGASASGRPWAAVWSDGVWVALMLVPFALGTRLAPAAIMSMWLFAAVVALVVALVGMGVLPDLRGGVTELRTRHSVGEASTFGAVIGSLGALWILFVASAAVSPVASGSLRGAATTMGPVNVLFAYLSLGLTPVLVRRARTGDGSFVLRASAALAGLTALWAVVLLLLPTSLGQAFFGQSWTGIRQVLPFTCLEYLLLGIGQGALLGLRVRHQARRIVVRQVVTGTITFAGGALVAFATRSTVAIAALTAFTALVGALLAWWMFARSGSAPGTNVAAGEPA